MICIKCKKEIPEQSKYCNHCGVSQEKSDKSHKIRGNGQGTVYKRSSGKWQAEVTLGYYVKDGKKLRRKLTKGGFDKKKDAIAYLPVLFGEKETKKHITISELWELFKNGKYSKYGNIDQSSTTLRDCSVGAPLLSYFSNLYKSFSKEEKKAVNAFGRWGLYRYYKVTMSYNGASYEKAMLHVISFSVNALPGYDPTV